MTDREKIAGIVLQAQKDLGYSRVDIAECFTIADRLIADGFRWMVRPYVKPGCGKDFDQGEDCGIYTCGGYVDGEEWLCEECRSKQ